MVVVDAQYVEPYVVDLAVQRKSGVNPNANFTVVDVNGSLMFNIKDTRFSFHDRHILYDAIDKPVLTFKKKLRSIHGRWQAFKGESTTHKDLLFSVKKSSAPKHETELDVFLVENKEETVCDCKVMGDWEAKSCTIYAQDCSTILAEVHNMQSSTIVNGNDTFGITVYPDVDYVFIVALVVILTEIKSYDGSGKKKKKKKLKSKKSVKKNSDSSDDDHKKNEKKDDNDGKETLEVKEDEEDEKDEDYDEEDEDDYDEEEEDYDDDESYDEDPKYDEEQKYNEYDDGDDDDEDEESSSDEDESPKEK